jgi:hypothetical protein
MIHGVEANAPQFNEPPGQKEVAAPERDKSMLRMAAVKPNYREIMVV